MSIQVAGVPIRYRSGSAEFVSAPSAPVSSVGLGSLRYNNSTLTFQASANGGAYTNIGGSGVAGIVISVQRFTALGTYTPTAGTAYAIVHMVGGGGSAGGREVALVSQSAATSGGAGGGSLVALLTAAQIGASQLITIGLGGAAAAIGAVGNAGGTTSVGALLSCTGGLGGLVSSAAGNTIIVNGVLGGVGIVSVGTPIMSVNGQSSGYGSKNTVTSGISYGGDSGGESMFGHASRGLPAISGTETASVVGIGAGSGSSGSSSHLFASSGAVSAAGTNGEVVIIEYR